MYLPIIIGSIVATTAEAHERYHKFYLISGLLLRYEYNLGDSFPFPTPTALFPPKLAPIIGRKNKLWQKTPQLPTRSMYKKYWAGTLKAIISQSRRLKA